MSSAFSRVPFDGPGTRAILEQAYPLYNPIAPPSDLPDPASLPSFGQFCQQNTRPYAPTPRLVDSSRRQSEVSSSLSTSPPTILTPLTSRGSTAPLSEPNLPPQIGRRKNKVDVPRPNNVSRACKPCKKAHIACDVQRPCRTCVRRGREHLCEDVEHLPRGRPKRSTTAIMKRGGGRAPFRTIRPIQTSSRSLHPSATSSTADGLQPAQPLGQWEAFEMLLSLDLVIFSVSPKADQHTGLTCADYLQRNLLDVLHPEDHAITLYLLRQLLFPLSLLSPTDVAAQMDRLHATTPTVRSPLSPVEGFAQNFPHCDARLIHSGNTYGLYNVRFHIGGMFNLTDITKGLLSSLHLVASFLPLPDQKITEVDRVAIDDWVENTVLTCSNGPLAPTIPQPVPAHPPALQSNHDRDANGHHYVKVCRVCVAAIDDENAKNGNKSSMCGEPI